MTHNCSNCKSEFKPTNIMLGSYCEECWTSWSKGDGSFEKRKQAGQIGIDFDSLSAAACAPVIEALHEQS
ncbi:hypothetical protein EVB91_214 [Rhizobium phage RHph_I1_18]|nr:hypothetical protein EVB91_214 [Rhizobium phage RHph_I1_18]